MYILVKGHTLGKKLSSLFPLVLLFQYQDQGSGNLDNCKPVLVVIVYPDVKDLHTLNFFLIV